ncbi:MAG: DUF3880 domain-containing protein, partial [Candidatus Firestonebacteria bacterium]
MKILLVAPSDGILGHIGIWMSKALLSAGHKISYFDYRRQGLFFIQKLREKAGINTIQKMNKRFFKKVAVSKPDLVLVLFGENIGAATLQKIKLKTPAVLANWFFDTVVSKYRKEFLAVYPAYYDYFFMIDIEKALGESPACRGNYIRLPLACDPEVHRKIYLSETEKMKYDNKIVFIGTVTPAREPILEYISDL